MKNILVAVDFTENEQKLIQTSLEVATAFNSKVWILHVSAPEPDFIGYDVGPQYIRDSRAAELKKEHKILYEYSQHLSGKGIEATGLLIPGGTIEMILAEVRKLKIDLIITGHHKHSFFYKALRGSTSERLIKKTDVPVLIVPMNR